ncbi:immunity 49 family protein [Nocardiopsis aegyptia]|uniref:immunity 49 family protein n=1 Tax=Nocardiopsis aegyptia TaxID=220378 RepID=UPI003671EE2C
MACHSLSERGIAQASDGIEDRLGRRWSDLYHSDFSLRGLQEMREEILDHVGAHTLENPALTSSALERMSASTLLDSAAECALGALGLTCQPDGDFDISLSCFPEADYGSLSSGQIYFRSSHVDRAPTIDAWVDVFALAVISGMVWDRDLVMGVRLRDDLAPTLKAGAPDTPLTPQGDSAGWAQMDALCLYLTPASGHRPRDRPSVPLREPQAEERAEAVRRLDAAPDLTPDQSLLRALLGADQAAFEYALADRLVRYRENVPQDAPPRSLLPIVTIAMAALAVQVYGWELNLRSGYLPQTLLGSPKWIRAS